MVGLRPRAGTILMEGHSGLMTSWTPRPVPSHNRVSHGPVFVTSEGRARWVGSQAGSGGSVCPEACLFQVLLLCQEGGLKLALNGQGLGTTSLQRQTLERLRELRVSGSVQLYCVHC